MKICIELFILDNTLMNMLIVMLSSAISGFRMRKGVAVFISISGGIYALCAIWSCPYLLTVMPKLAFGFLMALSFRVSDIRGYCRAVVCVFAAAAMMGGIVFLLTIIWEGSITSNILYGSTGIRITLIGFVVCLLLPRVIRALQNGRAQRDGTIELRITMQHAKQKRYIAFVDTGNFLIEPISGLPVIIVHGIPLESGRPVLFESMGGNGILYAKRPERVEILQQTWTEIDAMVAYTPHMIHGADAIIGFQSLPKGTSEQQDRTKRRKDGHANATQNSDLDL